MNVGKDGAKQDRDLESGAENQKITRFLVAVLMPAKDAMEQ